ncbi:hypothetical protein [Arundinibacter roseus]|uniref:Uncharacterized protein n=1 Tax=Arundinibacter roseus TaxID=2070510 RepID=A0A4R4KD37_9BACT|nr:hypothetical protein [Arundinibacter roseus]TDB64391.1 hypothetical protein EZE20_11960 [Arundinibacter roseus]
MPYFESLEQFIASVTARLNKPRRGVSGSEGVTAADFREAMIDTAKRAEDLILFGQENIAPAMALITQLYSSFPKITLAALRALEYDPDASDAQPAYLITDLDEFFRYDVSEAGADNGTTIVVDAADGRWVRTSLFQAAFSAKSVYEQWLDEGNIGSFSDMMETLVGEPGSNGASAYALWLADNPGGTLEDFFLSLKGDPGEDADISFIDGGTTGQVLAKASAVDKDVEWIDPPVPDANLGLIQAVQGGSSVTMTSADVQYTGCSLTLTPGTWLVSGRIVFTRNSTGISQYRADISGVGVAVPTCFQSSVSVNPHQVSMPLIGIITVASSTSISIKGMSSTTGCLIVYSNIQAVKIAP